jgi:hypothetical protein
MSEEPKHKTGRKTKYTDETVDNICALVQIGTPYRHACRACGISDATFFDWKATKPEFLDAIKKAESISIARDMKGIESAGAKSWQARAWRLERRFPNEFGRFDRLEVAEGSQNSVLRALSETIDALRKNKTKKKET